MPDKTTIAGTALGAAAVAIAIVVYLLGTYKERTEEDLAEERRRRHRDQRLIGRLEGERDALRADRDHLGNSKRRVEQMMFSYRSELYVGDRWAFTSGPCSILPMRGETKWTG